MDCFKKQMVDIESIEQRVHSDVDGRINEKMSDGVGSVQQLVGKFRDDMDQLCGDIDCFRKQMVDMENGIEHRVLCLQSGIDEKVSQSMGSVQCSVQGMRGDIDQLCGDVDCFKKQAIDLENGIEQSVVQLKS